MKDFFLEVFKYHHHFNQKILSQILEHHQQLPEKIMKLYCHMLNSHQIWNSRILGKIPFSADWEHSIEKSMKIDTTNYAETQKILDKYDLDKIISYRSSGGTKYSNSIRDILFHVSNHLTHHKGQIVAELRKSGIEPVRTDYIVYKREG